MKTHKHIIALSMSVMMFIMLMITPVSAQENVAAFPSSAHTASTLNEDFLGPVTSKATPHNSK